jgi:hypothetical protein
MLGQGASILHEIDLIVPFEVVGPCFLAKAASATGLGRHFKKSIAPTYRIIYLNMDPASMRRPVH